MTFVTSRQLVWLLPALLLPLTACDGRGIGNRGGETECWDNWECNPGRLCGEMVACVDFECRDDLDPVIVPCPGDDCVRDSDCVVAQPWDCCNGCPAVGPRDRMAEQYPCHYEQGTVPGPQPVECQVDCMACPLCFPQPLGARCELGTCVAVEKGCPTTGDASPPVVTIAQLLAAPQIYDGNRVRLRGTLLPGAGICSADCPAERCCEHAMTLDGVVALRGNPCEMQLGFWSERECADTFGSEGMQAGAVYEVTGTLQLNQSPTQPLSMEVDGLTLQPSAGLEGAYDITITLIDADVSDPVCVPPALHVGEPGRLYLAASDGRVQVQAPLFDCWPAFLGTDNGDDTFAARVPIDCDECCCDYDLIGEVTRTRIFGSYASFDGSCRYEYFFEGVRDPLPYPDPPANLP